MPTHLKLRAGVVFLTTLACALALGMPRAAQAGNYHAFLCAIPPGDTNEGAAAPTDGMSYGVNGAYMYAGASCGGGGGSMYALMDGRTTHPYSVTAADTFTVPSGLSIAAFNLWRYEEDGPTQPYGAPASNLSYSNVISVEGLCAQSLGCSSRGTSSPWYAGVNRVSVGNLSGVSYIQWTAACGGGPGGTCPTSGTTYSSVYEVFSLDAILSDPAPPTVSELNGAILAGGTFSGEQAISFKAADSGSGVYSQWLVVDGKTVSGPTIINTNGGACKDMLATKDGLRSFDHPQPCLPAVSGLVNLNTASLKDGSHTASLYVDDAAGNQTVAKTWSFVSNNAPLVVSAPSVSGLAQVGSVLSGSNGTFSAPSGAGTLSAITRQWLRCNAVGEKCSAISGATASTYTLTSEDAHHAIVFQNAVSDNDGQTVADSQPTLEVTEAPAAGGSCSGGCQQQGGGSSSTTNNTTTTFSSSSSSNESLSNEALAIARGAANGSPASDQARLEVRWVASAFASSVMSTYTRRARAEGRLVASDGRPIANALVNVLATPASPGYASFSEGTVTTAGDGTFVFDTQPRRPSRTLTFQYKSHANDVSLAAQAQLSIGVPAPISLRVSPRTVRRGSVIRMSGSVPAPIPSAGKQIVLQALAVGVRGARWQTFNVVRTDRKGRFKASYRFRFSGPARYRIRALTHAEQDYPYLASASASTLVKER